MHVAMLTKRFAACRGQRQVLHAIRAAENFFETNRLAAAFDDLQSIQTMFSGSECKVVSAKAKSGTLQVTISGRCCRHNWACGIFA